MTLSKAQCENCGAVLDVDNSSKTAVCPFCGTTYVVEKAITNYINHFGGTDIHSDAFLLNNGIKQIELCQYDDALDTFEKMSRLYPGNWKSWLGQELAYSCRDSIEYLDIDRNVKRCFPNSVLEKIGRGDLFLPRKIKQDYRLQIDDEYRYLDETKDELQCLQQDLKKLYSQLIGGSALLLLGIAGFVTCFALREIFPAILFLLMFAFSWIILLCEDMGHGRLNPCAIAVVRTTRAIDYQHSEIGACYARIKALEHECDFELTNPNRIPTIEYYLNLLES